MWHGSHCAAVVWHDGGCALAISHGSGRAKVVVGVRQRSHRVMVAARHGGGRWLHGLVMVAVVVSQRLWHGCGSSGCGNSSHVALQWPRGMMAAAAAACHATVQLQGGRRHGPSSYEAYGDGACVAVREAVNGLCSCEVCSDAACAAAREAPMWPI
jgi:hypothetical protein